MKEPKYKIGDQVWSVIDGKAHEREIRGVVKLYSTGEREEFVYFFGFVNSKQYISRHQWEDEHPHSSTKQDLINAL